MRYMISVLFLALAMEGVGFAEDKNKDKEFITAAGTFRVRITFGSYTAGEGGGLRHEALETPDGKTLPLFPYFRPDGTPCYEGSRGYKCSVEGFSDVGKDVYLVTDDGLWRWEGGNFAHVDSWENVLQVSDRFETDLGDVYTFIPDGGDLLFRGILFYDKEERKWVRAVENNSTQFEAMKVIADGGLLYIFHPRVCKVSGCQKKFVTFYNIGKKVFISE